MKWDSKKAVFVLLFTSLIRNNNEASFGRVKTVSSKHFFSWFKQKVLKFRLRQQQPQQQQNIFLRTLLTYLGVVRESVCVLLTSRLSVVCVCVEVGEGSGGGGV